MSGVTVASILDIAGTSAQDPFSTLRALLREEVYGTPSTTLLNVSKAFSALLGLNLALSLFLLVWRFRADHKPYRLYMESGGSFIVPNVILCWIGFNSIYLVLAFPFVWLGVLQQSGSRRNEPLWMCLVYLPLFWAVWHTAWGTTVSALIQSRRLKSDATISAPMLNTFFIAVLIAATAAMSGVTGAACITYNRGLDAYEELDGSLADAIARGQNSGGAEAVLQAIPNADTLVARMAAQWYHFEIPFGVCMSFALLAAVVMLVACAFQIRTLSSQIHYIKTSLVMEEGSAEPLQQSSAPAPECQRRKRGLLTVLRSVILTSLALCISMGVYSSVCVVGRGEDNVTKIFSRYKDGTLHLYVVLFVYGGLDLIILLLIAAQTFSKSASASKARRTPSKVTVASSQPPSVPTTSLVSTDTKSPADYASLPFSTSAYDPRLGSYPLEKYYEMDPSQGFSAYPTHTLAPLSDFAPRTPHSPASTLASPPSIAASPSLARPPTFGHAPVSPHPASPSVVSRSPPPAYPSRTVPEVSTA